jgi:hypothetical protein
MQDDTATTVSVAYHNSQSDLRAAALVAARVSPLLVRIQRWARFSLAATAMLGVVYALRLTAGSGAPLMLALLVAVIPIPAVLSSPRFFAFHTARNPTSRRALGEATFTAGPDGITTSASGTSGTFTWQAIDQVAEGTGAFVFMMGPHLFCYVPTRVLSNADRAVIRRLAGDVDGGPEWLDLRSSQA